MKDKLTIATRGSQLALWQANWIRDQIIAQCPQVQVELQTFKTQGDRILDHPLAKIGGKGLFVKELEEALLSEEADLAVHSMKDVPSELPGGLEISVITQREDPFDALIAPKYGSLDDLPQGAIVGTSSLRRKAQLLRYRPDLECRVLRGNVGTRLQKVHAGEYDASLLATSGLRRMGLESEIAQVLRPPLMLPAVAQGAIGIETRIGDQDTFEFLQHLICEETTACVTAERSLLKTLEGSCQVPLAGYCVQNGEQLQLTGLVASEDGQQALEYEAIAPTSHAIQLGQQVAQALLDQGADQILKALSR